MGKIKRCTKCRGSKIVMGLGGLERKCVACKGVGFESIVDEKDEDQFLNQEKPVIQYKKKKIDKRTKEYREGRTEEVTA